MCNVFKPPFAHTKHRPALQHHVPSRKAWGEDPAMMAPVILMGAMMMLVFWDTSDRG
jgi:hypothetical protein